MSEGYEERDVNTRKFVYFIVFIAAALAVTSLGVRWLFSYFERTAEISGVVSKAFEYHRALPPLPRLQDDPAADITKYLNSQQETLRGYGWIDRKQGVARIPIERAMQLILDRGLPVRRSGASPPAAPPESPRRTMNPAPALRQEAKQ